MERQGHTPGGPLRADMQKPPAKEYGTLKIFFGYAAGAGKTCAMLRAAPKRAASMLCQAISTRMTGPRPKRS